MAPLTAAQIAEIRALSGDIRAPYEVTDIAIQQIYDSTRYGKSDTDRTIYWVVYRRWADAARLVSLSGEFADSGSAQHNQKFEHLERLLAHWGRLTGLGLGSIRTGFLDLNLDEPDSRSEWQ